MNDIKVVLLTGRFNRCVNDHHPKSTCFLRLALISTAPDVDLECSQHQSFDQADCFQHDRIQTRVCNNYVHSRLATSRPFLAQTT